MRKRLFLHIGFAKTGTTTLQVMLLQNRRKLEKAGFLYPFARDASFLQRAQHIPLRVATTGHPYEWLWPEKAAQLDRVLADFNAVVARSTAPNVIVSSESYGVPNLPEEAIRNVREAFADFDVTVVAYIRKTDDYILSVLYQAFRSGRIRPVDEADFALRALHVGTILEKWREVFGADNVIVRPFGRDLLMNGDLVDDFLGTLGIGLAREKLILPESLNTSLSVQGLSVLFAYNRYREALGLKKISRDAIDLRQRLANALSAREEPGRHKMLSLSTAQRDALRSRYRAENALALEGSGVDVDAFFPEAPPGLEDNTGLIERFDAPLFAAVLSDLARVAQGGRAEPEAALSPRATAFLDWCASTFPPAGAGRRTAALRGIGGVLRQVDAGGDAPDLGVSPGGPDLGMAMAVLDLALQAAVERDRRRAPLGLALARLRRLGAMARRALRVRRR